MIGMDSAILIKTLYSETIILMEIELEKNQFGEGKNDSIFPQRKQDNLGVSVLIEELINFLTRQASIATFSTKTQYFFKFLWPLHSFFGYLLIADHPFSQKARQIFSALKNAQFFYRTLQTLLYSLNIILLVSILKKQQKQKATLTDNFLHSILKNFSILTRLSLYLTSFLLYFNFPQNLLAIAITTLIAILQSIFFENYCLKKQENYLTSSLLGLLLRAIIILNVVVNSIIVTGGFSSYAFCQSMFCFGFVTLIWFLKGGSNLFLHKLPKFITLLCCSITISLAAQSLLLLLHYQESAVLDLVELSIAFLIVSAYLYFEEQSNKQTFLQILSQKDISNLKKYQLNLASMQQQADRDADKNTVLIGVMQDHQFKRCQHLRCWTNTNELYDPYLKHNFDQVSLTKQKDSALKFYLKCLYECALQRKKSKEMMINYCQFMITEFGDYSKHCLYLAELLNDQDLSLLQKIKVLRLRVILQQISLNFNKSLFGGRVQLLQILNADLHFNKILQKIDHYCSQNSLIWQQFKLPRINLTQIRSKIQENMSTLAEIDEKWKKISAFFYVQKQWKHVYLNYYYYLKNLKIRTKEMQTELYEVKNAVGTYHTKFLVHKQNIFNDKMSDQIFFDKQSAVFLTMLRNDQLFFSKVGKSFKSLFHYSDQEVIGSPLNLIIPWHLQSRHHQSFLNWLQTGQSCNQKKYYGKQTEVIKKQGKQFFALVFYKIYISLAAQQNLINFACLVNTSQKIRKRTQNVDRKRNISQEISQGSSQMLEADYIQSLSHQIKFSQQNNIFMKDDLLQPTEQNLQIINIKYALRFVTFFFLVFCLVTGFIFYKRIVAIQGQTNSYQLLLTMYRYPIGLTTNYLANYLNVSSSSTSVNKISNQISSLSAQLSAAVKNPASIKILADNNLNFQSKYPPFSKTALNQGIVYDQIDLFYFIYSCLSDLSKQKDTSKDALMLLDSYLKPSYDALANKTKIQFHHSLQNELQFLKNRESLHMVAVGFVVLLGSVFVCWKYYEYQRKMRDFLDILVQFDSKYIKKANNYWKVIERKFNSFFIRYAEVSTEKAISSLNGIQKNLKSMSDCIDFIVQQKASARKVKNEVKLSQKRKNTFISQKAKHNLYKFSIITVLILSFMSISLMAIKINNMKELSNLRKFENEGNYIMRHYPNNEVLAYAFLTKFYSQIYPNETTFQPQKFSDTYSTFELMNKYDYLANNTIDSLFYMKYKSYFFGNPCISNPSVLIQADFTLQQCLTWGKNTLNNGISLYMRYLQPQISSFLGPSNTNPTFTKSQVMKISGGLSLTAYYIQDLINTWFDQFAILAQRFKQNDLTLIILMCLVVLLLHFIVFQAILFTKMEEDYLCLRKIYQNFVPEQILMSEKLIKQDFYLTGIIS